MVSGRFRPDDGEPCPTSGLAFFTQRELGLKGTGSSVSRTRITPERKSSAPESVILSRVTHEFEVSGCAKFPLQG